MKHLRKCLVLVLALIMILTMSVCTVYASSSSGDSFPGAHRYFYWDDDCWGDSVEVVLADTTQTIGNLKSSSSSNLKVAITSHDCSANSDDPDSNTNTYKIGMIAIKTGTYTVSYDVLNKSGKVVSSHKFKVYAYSDPITVTMAGSQASKLTGTSGVCKVTAKTGNTIKKIQIGKLKKVTETNGNYTRVSTEYTYTTIKNGAKVTYSKVLDESSSLSDTDNYYYSYKYVDGFAPTQVKVTYYDKYTKKNEVYTAYFYKKVK